MRTVLLNLRNKQAAPVWGGVGLPTQASVSRDQPMHGNCHSGKIALGRMNTEKFETNFVCYCLSRRLLNQPTSSAACNLILGEMRSVDLFDLFLVDLFVFFVMEDRPTGPSV